MCLRQTALIVKAQSDGQGKVLSRLELVVEPRRKVLLVFQMAEINIEIGVVYLSQQEGSDRVSSSRQLIASRVPACRLPIAEVIAARGIRVTDSRKLMVPVFEAGFQRVLAFDPGNVVQKLPAVRNTSLGNGVGLTILGIGNIRTIKENIRRTTCVNNGPHKSQARHPVLARRDRFRGKNPAVE